MLLHGIGSAQLRINADGLAQYFCIAGSIFDVIGDLKGLANAGAQIDPGAWVYAG